MRFSQTRTKSARCISDPMKGLVMRSHTARCTDPLISVFPSSSYNPTPKFGPISPTYNFRILLPHYFPFPPPRSFFSLLCSSFFPLSVAPLKDIQFIDHLAATFAPFLSFLPNFSFIENIAHFPQSIFLLCHETLTTSKVDVTPKFFSFSRNPPDLGILGEDQNRFFHFACSPTPSHLNPPEKFRSAEAVT